MSQNNNLLELLEKANIKVPHFVKPKLLSFIITVHDSKEENDENANANVTNKVDASSKSTPKSELDGKNEVNQTKPPNEQEANGDKNTDLNGKTTPKSQLNALPELKEVQSFGSVDLIPVSSSSIPELKVHEKPVKNYVEITPLLSNQNEKVLTKPETTYDSVQLKEQSNIQGKFYFVKCSNEKKQFFKK